MTTFHSAMKLVTKGGKARRAPWAKGTYLYLGSDKQIKCHLADETGPQPPLNVYSIHESDVLARDWEDLEDAK